MNFKKIIKKILNLKIHSTSLQNIQGYWVYRLSVRDVALIFEANYLKCFGLFFRNKKFIEFMAEYNSYFNKANKDFDTDLFRQKLYTKHLKLKAVYNSLLYANGENAKREFKEMFDEDYKDVSQLNKITRKNDLILERLRILKKPDVVGKKEKGISFVKLIAIVESSRGIEIDRNIKLWEFKQIYDIELEKWQTSK